MTNFIPIREPVQATPYAAQKIFVDEVVANNGLLQAQFDLAVVLTDASQLITPTASDGIPAVGPYLSVWLFANQIGTLDILGSIDPSGSFKSLISAPLAVAASTLLTVVSLAIPARLVSVEYRNTSGGNATVSFGSFIRSN